MGVLNCDRNGCDNVMCDRSSHEYGYICDECFEELVQFYKTNKNIEYFMDTPKSKSPNSTDDNKDELDNIFVWR